MRQEWTKIDVEELRASLARRVNLSGVETVIAPSPYDIPQEVRAFLSHSGPREVVVEMRYLSEDENYERQQLSDAVSFEVGSASGRIKRIFFSVDALRRELGSVQIDQVLADAFDGVLKECFRENEQSSAAGFRYEISRNVLADRGRPLLRQVVPSS